MTQEEKDLVLTDLCGRLPYDMKIKDEYGDYINVNLHNANIEHLIDRVVSGLDKMVLRPMETMTEEERKELKKLMNCDSVTDYSLEYTVGGQVDYDDFLVYYEDSYKLNDWLNKNMFDYRGLIPKGLALEAKEGMYND